MTIEKHFTHKLPSVRINWDCVLCYILEDTANILPIQNFKLLGFWDKTYIVGDIANTYAENGWMNDQVPYAPKSMSRDFWGDQGLIRLRSERHLFILA